MEGGAFWFTVPAALGSAVFALRVVMMLLGGDADVDGGADPGGGDVDFDAGAGTDAGAGVHGDLSTHAFQILSVQSIAAFCMGFGWAGLAALKGSEWGLFTSLLVGFAVGVGMVWLIVWMFRLIYSLRASGNIPIERALGAEGTVYVTVPGQSAGRGQVRVVIDNHQRLYRAVTEGERLARQARVRVVRVNRDNTVTVALAD